MHSQKFTVGMAILPSSQYRWLTGQPTGPQHNQIAPAYSKPIGLVTVGSTSSSFTSISEISISLGVPPLDPLLGLRPWNPMGDFCPPANLPLCVNPSPKVTKPWTPLVWSSNCRKLVEYGNVWRWPHVGRQYRTLIAYGSSMSELHIRRHCRKCVEYTGWPKK